MALHFPNAMAAQSPVFFACLAGSPSFVGQLWSSLW